MAIDKNINFLLKFLLLHLQAVLPRVSQGIV